LREVLVTEPDGAQHPARGRRLEPVRDRPAPWLDVGRARHGAPPRRSSKAHRDTRCRDGGYVSAGEASLSARGRTACDTTTRERRGSSAVIRWTAPTSAVEAC